MKIALCQTTVHKDWHKNLRNAERVIADAVKSKADMVVLPEMFICPYNKKAISAAAQPEKADRLASIARCICLILMWKVDSIIVSPASLRPEMKCVLSKQNLVRLV